MSGSVTLDISSFVLFSFRTLSLQHCHILKAMTGLHQEQDLPTETNCSGYSWRSKRWRCCRFRRAARETRPRMMASTASVEDLRQGAKRQPDLVTSGTTPNITRCAYSSPRLMVQPSAQIFVSPTLFAASLRNANMYDRVIFHRRCHAVGVAMSRRRPFHLLPYETY